MEEAGLNPSDWLSDPRFFKEMLDNLYDGVYFVDRDRRILYWNRGAARLTGYSPEEVLGHYCRDNLLAHTDMDGNALCTSACPLAATLNDGQIREAEVFARHRSGHRTPVLIRVAPVRVGGCIVGAVEVFSDNTVAVRARHKTAMLAQMASMDPLTQIGNRRHVEWKIEDALQSARRSAKPSGFLMADVDHFKRVNDDYGHPAGDAVLRMIALTLAGGVRDRDCVGRWGGEEFAIVLEGAKTEEVFAIAERLRKLVAASALPWNGNQICVTISIGATAIRRDDTPASLADRADRLLYASKSRGRNRITTDCIHC